ncbi:MAG: esterase [Burkholderiales bacterium]|nr:esterase [Burkholderiales bacterium]
MKQTFAPYPGDKRGRTETVSVETVLSPGGLRRFTLTSTQPQRDQAPQRRVLDEQPGAPRVQSPSLLFDALFAQALDDARLNSVAQIRDGAYNGGKPIDCRCFQTGEFWTYVWTRDLAYATHLGLAWLDPERAASSLLFKTSGWRDGVKPPPGLPPGLPPDSLQIVQDTGSGGSWPVSTDRVTWAFGAQSVLDQLQGAERRAFAARARAALRGTVEADRLAAYDPSTGLYGGEQSFLDWRVQSYAPWIADHLSRLAGSRALSTNVAHYQALRLLAQFCKADGDVALAARYQAWADDLRVAIDRAFWLPDVQQYASLTNDDATPVALHKFDLLGTALAVISGVAPPERAAQALANYPHAPFGAPVIAPQQPGVPVYHNRAIWPFVTAYELRAAAQVGNPAVAGHAFDSLVRAAALNLSNMENLEWLTGLPRFDDGPVVNSRRQIWSVAGYLGAVAESVFGWQVSGEGLRIQPFLTTTSRRALGDGPQATLTGMAWRGRRVEVMLHLPPLPAADAAAAFFPVLQILLNGQVVTGTLGEQQLRESGNRIEVHFDAPRPGDARLRMVPTVDPLDRAEPRVVAPDAPRLEPIKPTSAGVMLQWAAPTHREALHFNVYRDGHLLTTGLEATHWTDRGVSVGEAHVYEVEAVGLDSGVHSHLSEPVRVDAGAVRRFKAGELFALASTGPVGFELLYDNHAYETQTGVTNALRVLRVLDVQGREVARGVVQMPHIDPVAGKHPLRLSTPLRTVLPAGRYRVELADFFNMSYLQANANYSGPGGLGGPLNEAEVQAVQVVTLPR